MSDISSGKMAYGLAENRRDLCTFLRSVIF